MAKLRFHAGRAGLVAIYACLAAAAAGVLVYGLVSGATAFAVAGTIGLLAVAAAAPVAWELAGLRAQLRGTEGAAEPVGHMLEGIREHTMLSDNAKRVLFRDRETRLLRDAIEEDIARGDHNAALAICDEMANVFGYRREAEAYRSRIAQARQAEYEREVGAELELLEAHLDERNWAAVHQQAARIRRLYPDSHLVGGLDERIAQARYAHTRHLEARFLEAAGNDDVRGAMALLKQLDLYLGREEAARLREVAEGVIVRHREQLGTQFRTAVSERRWAHAARLGESIVSEFPNSKMAAEVKSMLEVLHTRAG